MAANVWFGPGPLNDAQKRLCIRRYARESFDSDASVTAKALERSIDRHRPRAIVGGYKSKTTLQIERELKRARAGKPFMTRFKRRRKCKALTVEALAKVTELFVS